MFEYLPYYLHIFVFLIVIFIISIIRCDKNSCAFDYIKESINNTKWSGNSNNSFILLVVVVLGVALSLFMYSIQIGVRGLPQRELPFHLTGILYYFREIVLSGIIIFLFFRNKSTTPAFFICIYAFIVGFSSCSRGLVGILLIPTAIICFFKKQKVAGLFVLLFFVWLHEIITISREYLYTSPIIGYSFYELVLQSINTYFNDSSRGLLQFAFEASNRLYGCQKVILGGQARITTTWDIFRYYLGVDFGNIVPNLMQTVFHLTGNPSMKFGVSIGFVGQMLMLSKGNLIITILQSIWVGFILSIQEKATHFIISSNCSKSIKLISIGITLLAIMLLWMGLSFGLIYLLTLVLWLLKRFRIKSQRFD